MEYTVAYEKRTLWAQNRSKLNAQNDRLNEKQHRAIAMLCYYRHNFHKHMNCLCEVEAYSYSRYINFFLKQMPIMLHTVRLPELDINSILITARIDSLEDSIEVGEEINERIEDYLRTIDESYGTWYAPMGYTRNSWLCS